MLNIGFWELFLIVVVGLIVIGPKQLPEVAKTVARTLRKLRRTTDGLRESAREVVNEVIPPEDLYGYGSDDDDDEHKQKTLAPPSQEPLAFGAAAADDPNAKKPGDAPDAGDSSLAS